MIDVNYLGVSPVTVAVLPARVAYLISETSTTGFRRAVQEASCRWGGMTEPVIPVKSNGQCEPW